MKFVATDRVLFFSAIICTCLTFPTIPQRTEAVSSRLVKRYAKRSNASDMAEMMLEYGDVNYDGLLTQSEVLLFFKNSLEFPDEEANQVSSKMIELGDLSGDEKLDFLEAAIAIMIISDTWESALM
ncbi:uncharacterized protein LOC132553360 [Ylistrum balloti]|uniref:uncharacterized protein LOC132553360 n=1 Tax=Ylistrum balloti TaxID=509963 RepID=UPI002905C407|nr:uncharacterized protein LOC132553360 [Ylistrum balloti]